MLFLLILPILVAGFLACHIHPVHSYKLHRYEGQYLYLKSAELGIHCFALAFLVCLLLHKLVPNPLNLICLQINTGLFGWLENELSTMGVQKSEGEALKLSWFLILSSTTFLAAFIIKTWANIRLRLRFGTWDAKVYVIGELLSDSPLDSLLFELSLDKSRHAMLTMSDRKVYVGKVIDLGEPTETDGMDQDISIMPLMSGYREKDGLKVNFTTHYEDVDSDIYLSLRQEAIVSVTEFDFEAYQKWNPKSQDEPSGSEVNPEIIDWLKTLLEKLRK